MHPEFPGWNIPRRPRILARKYPQEWKLVPMRDQLAPDQMALVETPQHSYTYWEQYVVHSPLYDASVENFICIILNTRRRATGFFYVSRGTMDTILVHPREVFKGAIVANAAALVLGHNHPSGDPTPSESDVKVTRDLIRAGDLLKISVLDHIIVGHPHRPKPYASLRELGYFYS